MSQADKERIEGAIQKAVMQEVAVVDLEGDLAVTPGTALAATRGLDSSLGGIVLGLILKVKEALG